MDPRVMRQALLANRLVRTRAFQGATFTYTLTPGQPSVQIAENPGDQTSAFLIRINGVGRILLSTSSGTTTEFSLPAQGGSNVLARVTLGPDEQLWAQRPAGPVVTLTATEVRL